MLWNIPILWLWHIRPIPIFWLTNGDGFVLVYGYTETVYAPRGMYIRGVRGTVDSYNGLIQLKDATVGEKVEGMTMLPEPMEAEIGDIATYMQTRYLVLNGVTITGQQPQNTRSASTAKLQLCMTLPNSSLISFPKLTRLTM